MGRKFKFSVQGDETPAIFVWADGHGKKLCKGCHTLTYFETRIISPFLHGELRKITYSAPANTGARGNPDKWPRQIVCRLTFCGGVSPNGSILHLLNIFGTEKDKIGKKEKLSELFH